jgi:hypothetical protein
MFKEGSPIAYDARADLKKWPSLNGQRLNAGRQPYLVFNGTLAECIRELMAKPVKQISLYDIVTEPQRCSIARCYPPATPRKSPCARISRRGEDKGKTRAVRSIGSVPSS